MTVAAPYSAPPAARMEMSLFLILLGGTFTGFSGILVRLSEIGLIATGGWRMIIATAALLPVAAAAGNKDFTWRGSPLLLLAGLFFAVDMAFYHWSLALTSIAHSTLIVNLAPLLALSAGFFLFGERLGPAKLFGLVAALGGALLMTAMRSDSAGTLTGNGLAAIGMVGYALYLVLVKQARAKHDTLSIMLWSSGTAAVALFLVAGFAGEQILPRTAEGWSVVIALGVVGHVLGQGLVAFGMRTAPVGLASILLLVQPVVAAIAAWVIFAENLTVMEIAGAAMVLTGLAIASRSQG